MSDAIGSEYTRINRPASTVNLQSVDDKRLLLAVLDRQLGPNILPPLKKPPTGDTFVSSVNNQRTNPSAAIIRPTSQEPSDNMPDMSVPPGAAKVTSNLAKPLTATAQPTNTLTKQAAAQDAPPWGTDRDFQTPNPPPSTTNQQPPPGDGAVSPPIANNTVTAGTPQPPAKPLRKVDVNVIEARQMAEALEQNGKPLNAIPFRAGQAFNWALSKLPDIPTQA